MLMLREPGHDDGVAWGTQHARGNEQIEQPVEARKATRPHLDPATLKLLVAPQQRDQLTIHEAILPAHDEGGAHQVLQIVEGGHAVVW